jgi:hypothetical protein
MILSKKTINFLGTSVGESRNVNFLIVGAAKAGTTTLVGYLKQHPQIFMPEDELYKEPAFFSRKGERMGIDKYLRLFDGAKPENKMIGEGSTAYLTDKVSAKRIYTYNPNMKIILILRNPIKRAYSLYNWMVQEGYEYAKNFENALLLEKTRKNKQSFFQPEYYWNYMYFSSGLYYEQVKRYLTEFNPNNILILIFEEMIKDTKSTFKNICEFLNVDFVDIEAKKENESRKVYHPFLSFWGRKIIDYMINPLFKPESKIKRDCILYKLQKQKKPDNLNSVIKKTLLSKYTNDIKDLEILINKDLSLWK